MNIMEKINSAMISTQMKFMNKVYAFAEDETGDFAQYALLIIIAVAIAAIVSNALTGWVQTVMDKLTSFSSN